MAGSIKGQIVAALGAIKAKPGESRHIDKLKGDGSHLQKLYGHKTYERYRDALIPFAQWAKQEYGVKLLAQIPPEAAARYAAEQNWTAGTLKTFVAAVNKLEIGIREAFGRVVDLGSRNVETGTRSLADRTNIRPFSPQDARAIVDWGYSRAERLGNVAPAIGLHLAYGAGLRASEVVGLRVGQIDVENRRIIDVEGKGGRLRTVENIPQSLMDRLKAACEGKRPDDRVIDCSRRTLERWTETAKEVLRIDTGNGVHGLRGAFAQERLSAYIERGLSHEQALRQVSQDLGHNRISVLRHYL